MHSGGRSAMLALATRSFSSSIVESRAAVSVNGTTSAQIATTPAIHQRRECFISNAIQLPPKLFLGLDRKQPVLLLPLVIRILPIGRVKKEVIITRRRLKVFQMITGRSPQKICDRIFRQQLGACIQRPYRQVIIFVLAGCERQIAIRFAQVRLQLHRRQKFLLRSEEHTSELQSPMYL